MLNIKKMIKSNNIIKALILGLLVMISYSCADPDEKPILTFDDAIKGSYPRVTSTSGAALVDPNNLSSSSFGYSVEFVDETNGVDVTEFKFTMSYNGGSEVDMPGRTYTSADFTKNADGYMSMDIPAFTATELSGLAGITITAANAAAKDYFTVKSYLSKGGLVFSNSNKSSTITGPAFAGRFDTTFPVACPSDMFIGEVAYSSDLYWNGFSEAPTATGVNLAPEYPVTIIENSPGNFTFNDWSFGGYQTVYDCCTATGDFGFTDLCGVVTFGKTATDSYGDPWEMKYFMAADNVTLTVGSYGSAYDENAIVTITFPVAQTWTCSNCEASLADITF
jgi:hypothetical protein